MAVIEERLVNHGRVIWLAVVLALFTAASYVLMGQHLLQTGLNVDAEGGAIVYVAAGGYLLGGLLILLRRRSLWIAGLAINTLVLFFFFSMYSGNTTVLLSPAGLASKASQLLLEVGLVYLIVTDWVRVRTASRPGCLPIRELAAGRLAGMEMMGREYECSPGPTGGDGQSIG